MTVLVTGATGFLGSALSRRLLADGVRVTASGRNEALAAPLIALGARFVRADLTDPHEASELVRGHDVVYHCAALSSPWGPEADFYRANVLATRHVVRACLDHGVRRLVHVSTPSVYVGLSDRRDIREHDPLPRGINAYARTKLLAEQEVLSGVQAGLSALMIRPRAIVGPGDNAIMPRLIAALKRRRLPIVGSGENVTDLTYVDDAVQALLLSAAAPEGLSGRVYNITGGDPQPLWPLLLEMCDRLDLPRPRRRLPRDAAMALAGVLEAAARVTTGREPPLTRYAVSVLTASVTLNIDAARRDLGYAPRVPVREGLRRYTDWLREQGGVT